MRRGLMLVLGLLTTAMALATVPAPAKARDLPSALLGVITRPLGAIFGAPRYSRRSHRPRKANTRSRAPAAAQTQPATVPPAAAAAGGAAVGAAAAAAVAPAEAKTATEAAAPPEKTAAPAEAANAATTTATTGGEPKTESKSAPVAPENEKKPVAQTTPAQAKPTQPSPEPASSAAAPIPAPGAAQRTVAVSRPAEPASRNSEQPPARQQPTAAAAARGTLRSGVTGPLTWPTALEDVVGFTLWPGEYSERLRAHGIGDVLNAVMIPASVLAGRIRPGGTTMARADSRQNAAASGGSLGICNMEPASDDWLTPQLERSIQLSAEQRAALGQLKNAFGEASVRIKAACRDEASSSSAERLRSMQTMLWAVHDAAIQLRAPISKFYDTLTPEQRQKFAAPASAQADPRSMTPQAIAKLCGAPQSNDAMLRQAEQSLNLNRAQRTSLDTFQKKAAEMGQFLMASCLKPVASTPVERIDAAADRLTALIFAASTVNLALNDFYGQLDDAQRAKFDAAVR